MRVVDPPRICRVISLGTELGRRRVHLVLEVRRAARAGLPLYLALVELCLVEVVDVLLAEAVVTLVWLESLRRAPRIGLVERMQHERVLEVGLGSPREVLRDLLGLNIGQ